jgi:hypothetical protein
VLLGCADDGFVVHAIGQMHRRQEECVGSVYDIRSLTAKKKYDFLSE